MPTFTDDPNTPALPSTLTITYYQQLAQRFITAFDEIAAIIPQLEARHITTVDFVRTHQNVSLEFLARTVAAVEQSPALLRVGTLDVTGARDTLQFIDAFGPVLTRVMTFEASLKFNMQSRKATLVADALQMYAIAKGVARDPRSVAVASRVAGMKRELGRRGPARTRATGTAASAAAIAGSPPEVS